MKLALGKTQSKNRLKCISHLCPTKYRKSELVPLSPSAAFINARPNGYVQFTCRRVRSASSAPSNANHIIRPASSAYRPPPQDKPALPPNPAAAQPRIDLPSPPTPARSLQPAPPLFSRTATQQQYPVGTTSAACPAAPEVHANRVPPRREKWAGSGATSPAFFLEMPSRSRNLPKCAK